MHVDMFIGLTVLLMHVLAYRVLKPGVVWERVVIGIQTAIVIDPISLFIFCTVAHLVRLRYYNVIVKLFTMINN